MYNIWVGFQVFHPIMFTFSHQLTQGYQRRSGFEDESHIVQICHCVAAGGRKRG